MKLPSDHLTHAMACAPPHRNQQPKIWLGCCEGPDAGNQECQPEPFSEWDLKRSLGGVADDNHSDSPIAFLSEGRSPGTEPSQRTASLLGGS